MGSQCIVTSVKLCLAKLRYLLTGVRVYWCSDQSRRHRHDSVDTDQLSYMTQSPDVVSLASVASPPSNVDDDLGNLVLTVPFTEVDLLGQLHTRQTTQVQVVAVSSHYSITRNILHCDQSNYSSCIVFLHTLIEFGHTRNSAIRMDDPSWRYRHLNLPRWRQLGFGETGNSTIRSADLENPTIEPNMKWIGRPLAEISPFEIFPNVRWVGRRSPVGRQYILLLTLISYTPLRYIRNVAREE